VRGNRWGIDDWSRKRREKAGEGRPRAICARRSHGMIHPFGVELAGQFRASKGGHARAAGCARLTGEEGVGGQPARRHLRLHRARTYRPWQRWCPRLTSRLRGWEEDESGCDRNESISPACVDQRFLSVGGGTSGEMCSGGHITGGLSSLAVAPPPRLARWHSLRQRSRGHGSGTSGRCHVSEIRNQ